MTEAQNLKRFWSNMEAFFFVCWNDKLAFSEPGTYIYLGNILGVHASWFALCKSTIFMAPFLSYLVAPYRRKFEERTTAND